MKQQDFDELQGMIDAYKAVPRAAGAADPTVIIDVVITIINMFLAPANPALAAILVKVGEIIKGFFQS